MNLPVDFGKIALGTVQFGVPYGVANQSGQVQPSEVTKILNLARSQRINTLDTAIAYGESEAVLGRQHLDGLSVITKLPGVPEGCDDVTEWVQLQVENSLARLNLSKLEGLLLHRPGQLLGSFGNELYQQMRILKQQGVVQRIGISVYGPEELEALCDRFHSDIIQAPFNILDRRLSDSGWLERLQGMGTALHVRSVFMQGLLLMSKEQRPEKFSRWDMLWQQWAQWLEETGQTPVEACLRHALSIPEIEKVVVGVDSYAQLHQIIHAANGSCITLPEGLWTLDNQLLNPSCWNNL